MENQHNNSSLPSQGNRNLANMAQEAEALVGQIKAGHERAIDDAKLMKYLGDQMLEHLKCFEEIQRKLSEMHVFLAREAAFGEP